MAGIGIGPGEFALFDIRDPEDRTDRLERLVAPALARIGDELVEGLSRVTGARLLVFPGKLLRRRGAAPGEIFVAFGASDRGYRAAPHLVLAMSREYLHARVAVRASVDRDGAIRRALQREAANLARKGKPFRKLRNYVAWDYEVLPEIAPAQSTAFWMELADDVASERHGGAGIDVGVAWSFEEARSLAVGDVLGAFRDLAPLYKLLGAACNTMQTARAVR